MCIEDGQNLVIIASNGGAPYHPVWYLNFRANPEARVLVKDQNLRVTAEEAKGEEGRRLFARLVGMYPGYENYQRRTERDIPVAVLHPASS